MKQVLKEKKGIKVKKERKKEKIEFFFMKETLIGTATSRTAQKTWYAREGHCSGFYMFIVNGLRSHMNSEIFYPSAVLRRPISVTGIYSEFRFSDNYVLFVITRFIGIKLSC